MNFKVIALSSKIPRRYDDILCNVAQVSIRTLPWQPLDKTNWHKIDAAHPFPDKPYHSWTRSPALRLGSTDWKKGETMAHVKRSQMS